MSRRIVVTGIGVISSIGIGRDEFWSSLIQGKSGISPITSFDTSEYPTHLGGEIKNFNPALFMEKGKTALMGRASCMAIAAAKLALKDSCLGLDNIDRARLGVALGTTMAESQVFEKLNESWVRGGQAAIDPKLIPQCPADVIPFNVAGELGICGPSYIIPCACAAGNYAIGYACDLIRMGRADIMFAGGVDAFSKIAFTGFNRLLAAAPDACRPFDKNRKGIMVGEGAGVIILETKENALSRGADIYAEVLGYGLSCDARHMTAPFSEGIKEAIVKALKDSGIAASDVDYFNAHGTGTPANDREECLAIKKAFGEYAPGLAVSSTKSMLGHTMGAASGIEALVCCLAVKSDIAPPTINYETPDPDCDIDCVPNQARKMKIDIALNNASAFGGNNAAVVFKKYPSGRDRA